jgi:hypothetical protein
LLGDERPVADYDHRIGRMTLTEELLAVLLRAKLRQLNR